MVRPPPALGEFECRLSRLEWVSALWVGGSLATGDYSPGVSDLDLVAITDGPVDSVRQFVLADLHRDFDRRVGQGLKLGCAYVDAGRLSALDARHATWTHGQLVHRTLSAVARAELVRDGYALLGPPPLDRLPDMSDDEVREAAKSELRGYWAWATRRPILWLDPIIVDLGLTSMARGRHTMATGELLTKTKAIEFVDAPQWLVDQLRARRRGEAVKSPRMRSALIAWRDALRTVARARA